MRSPQPPSAERTPRCRSSGSPHHTRIALGPISRKDHDGFPAAAAAVDDVRAEFQRLQALGVRSTQEPVDTGPVATAVLDDTCGLIQIAQYA